MKLYRKSFLFLILFLFCGVVSANEASYRSRIFAWPVCEKSEPVAITTESPIAGTLNIPVPFHELSFYCPSYSDNIGEITFSLFRWQKDYKTTTSGKVLATKTFVNFKDNETLYCTFKELPPGQYLWVLHSPKQQVGIWMVPLPMKGVTTFANGIPLEKTCMVGYGITTSVPFMGRYEDYIKYRNRTNTVPKEPKLTANDPLRQLDVMPETWYATDALGRVLPDSKQCGPVRPGKQVGIFYWTWHKFHADIANGDFGPHDNTKIIAEFPNAVDDINHPAWGPINHPHHWGEPLFGYYTTIDRWVLRKHAELLADAMIDVVIFDATNGTFTWMDSTRALLETFAKARADGVKTPKIAFMLPFWSLENNRVDLLQLYRDIYRDQKYQDLWFYWQGKPLIYAIPESVADRIPSAPAEEKADLEAILSFFSFRPGQPAYMIGPKRPDHWSWLEIYPQHGYGQRTDGTYEMVAVGVSQNYSSNSRMGKAGLAAMNDQNVFGRAHVVGKENDARPNAFLYGANFQQQWSRAFELDPDFVFVTGWNEWIAGRAAEWNGTKNAFPDQFNEEFSRDIEPARGQLKDNYYLQLVANVRKFKGVRPLSPASGPKTIHFNTDSVKQSDEWTDVLPVYRDYQGDILHRKANGYGKIYYTNTTGRNDIVRAKVARDKAYVYFMVETNQPLSDPKGNAWMRLFFSLPSMKKETPNWETFQYVVNRTKPGILERSLGGWNWETVGSVEYRIQGNRLEIAVPKKLVNLAENQPLDLYFKWSDNMQVDGDILDFYENGDTAPDARFTYRYCPEQ